MARYRAKNRCSSFLHLSKTDLWLLGKSTRSCLIASVFIVWEHGEVKEVLASWADCARVCGEFDLHGVHDRWCNVCHCLLTIVQVSSDISSVLSTSPSIRCCRLCSSTSNETVGVATGWIGATVAKLSPPDFGIFSVLFSRAADRLKILIAINCAIKIFNCD